MKEIDLHGLKVAEAEEIFYDHLNRARMEKKLIEIAFITGVGVIQQRLKEMCAENELNQYVQMGNRGVIVIEFE